MVAVSAEPVAMCRGSETVLVVEDDPQVREVTLRALRAGGYRVLAASCGREALEVAGREERPMHLLVTDLIMPGLNGRQLADELRRGRPGLRVLFVSGYAGEVITQAGADDAGVELLDKPFTTVTLLARVRALLDAR
jgi:CheY-like chemotaxis protein